MRTNADEVEKEWMDLKQEIIKRAEMEEIQMGSAPGIEKGGVKHDENKVRYDLIPHDAMHEIARVLTFGAERYGDRNWEKGIKYGRLYAASQRHLTSFWRGNKINHEDFGLHHLAHAATCILMLLSHDLNGMQHMDDRPIRGEHSEDQTD